MDVYFRLIVWYLRRGFISFSVVCFSISLCGTGLSMMSRVDWSFPPDSSLLIFIFLSQSHLRDVMKQLFIRVLILRLS